MVGWLEGITLSFFNTGKEQLLFGKLQSTQRSLHGNDHIRIQIDLIGITVSHELAEPAVERRPRPLNLNTQRFVRQTVQGVDNVHHDL